MVTGEMASGWQTLVFSTRQFDRDNSTDYWVDVLFNPS